MRHRMAHAAMLSATGLLLAAPVIANDIGNLAWLAGCWQQSTAEGAAFEHWTPASGGVMLGTGRTLRSGRLVAFEFMQIRPMEDGRLAFVAQPSGLPSVTLEVKSLNATRVVFENREREFPQRVTYARTGDGDLLASVWGVVDGRERSVEFPMQRVDCTTYFAAPG